MFTKQVPNQGFRSVPSNHKPNALLRCVDELLIFRSAPVSRSLEHQSQSTRFIMETPTVALFLVRF